jgi:hypothetical protein
MTIAASDVTVDCRGFIINGSPAGAATMALGIYGNDRTGVAVRNCTISGFLYGIRFDGSGLGYSVLVEDNVVEGNTAVGISVHADASTVRHNSVFNTGGSTISPPAEGIETFGTVQVAGNTVSGVHALAGSNDVASGIFVGSNPALSLSGNTVMDLVPDGNGWAYGIYIDNQLAEPVALSGNKVTGPAGTGWGVYCANNAAIASNNPVTGFQTSIVGCSDGGGNTTLP